MATQSSYTTVKVSRFGFSVLSVTFDRVNTEDVKAVVCSLIASATKADSDEIEHINIRWDESIKNDPQFVMFDVEAGGDYTNDYHVSIRHFNITDEQVRLVMNTSRDVLMMFF